MLLKGKFMREDIESPKKLLTRLTSAFSEFKDEGNYLVFAHSGVLQVLLHELRIYDLFLRNCGSLSLILNEQGRPIELIKYWNHGY